MRTRVVAVHIVDRGRVVAIVAACSAFYVRNGEGGFSPASSVTIADNFKREERGRAKAFLLSTDYLGSAIGSGVIALFIMTYGWHTSYQYLGVVGALVAALLFWCLPPQTKRDASVAHDARAG